MNQLHDDAHKVLREAFELQAVSIRSAQAAGHTCYASLTECVAEAWYRKAAELDESVAYFKRRLDKGEPVDRHALVWVDEVRLRRAQIHAELVMLGFNV